MITESEVKQSAAGKLMERSEVAKLLAEIHNLFYRTPDGDHCAYLGQRMFEKVQAAIGAYRPFVASQACTSPKEFPKPQ